MEGLKEAFEAEITRLMQRGLSQEDELIARRYYSQKERDSMDDSDFCGPHQSFPVKSQEDVNNAARLVGHADNPDAVKHCIIGKAKANGWSIPDAWKRADQPVIVRADGSHDAMSGSHSHAHPAFGSQGGDGSHTHEHSHSNDADHKHSHAEEKADQPDILRSLPAELQLYMPILRIDREKREIMARATSEAKDKYKTVFDYNASKEAFSKWRGNIREMHDSTKAVGRAVKWTPLDEEKAVDVILRVSRGAEDTWQKVLDGTLSGLSVGAKNGVWEKRTINGEEVPVLTRYDLVEVSLVDNPANPDCNIQIVRADGLITDVLDDTEENSQPTDTRAGKAISAATAGKMHQSMLHSLQAAKTSADMCNCPACQAVSTALDPDQDGDIDIIPELDTDGDQGGAGDVEASLTPTILRIVKETIEQTLQPTVQRYSAIAARLAQTDTPDITRRLDEISGLKSELSEVRSALAEVKGITESYANRASSGGPVVNTGNMRGAPPAPMQPQQLAAQYAPFVELLIKSGIIRDREQQIQANLLVQQLANGG